MTISHRAKVLKSLHNDSRTISEINDPLKNPVQSTFLHQARTSVQFDQCIALGSVLLPARRSTQFKPSFWFLFVPGLSLIAVAADPLLPERISLLFDGLVLRRQPNGVGACVSGRLSI